ncbi:hypothetical protein BXY66_1914 [Shimia isoporae]|uniref:Uncharacterized protein n=1 Tax=Shimia isoporae TaxID=647720 RepID=A0A4R1NPR8_9RHOB|nr:hypothetical protein [Shimia isoporae]TCL09849.1 hypothetical protein BXY66_1914 [Shimia isoporae]
MVARTLTLLLCASFALTACDRRKDDQFAFNGIYFKSTSDQVSKEVREHFEVNVKGANQDLKAAREAGRYEGTRYCIKEYGTSRIDWVVGPENEAVVPVDDVLRLEGICRPT